MGWTGAAAALVGIGIAYLAGAAISSTGWVSDPGLGIAGAVAAGLTSLLACLNLGGRAPFLGLVLGLILAVSLFTGPDLAVRSGDPHSAAIAGVWARRLILDAALGSGLLHALSIDAVIWVSGGWLAWSIVRLNNPLPGLLPVTGVFAVGLLNSRTSNNLIATGFLTLVLALLLLTSLRRVRRLAAEMGGTLRTAASRRYWALASAIVAVAVLGSAALPALSTIDTSDVLQGQLTAIRTWLGDTTAGAGHAGFSFDAPLNGPLLENSQVVFSYTLPTGSPGAAPLYFRGADLTLTSAGQWRFAARSRQTTIPAGTQIQYSEAYQDTTAVSVQVRPINPPPAAPSTFFYPGQLAATSVPLTVSQSALSPGRTVAAALHTLDLAEVNGLSVPPYLVQSMVSTATPDQLRAAGNAYPAWTLPYTTVSAGSRITNLAGGTYRPAATVDRIHRLALRVTANAENPYEQAMAVEGYLRSNYRYSLTPPVTAAGKDPIDLFLFNSKTGYCQFFATAMGDMLRSLGIPTRLVNGFGPGSATSTSGQYAVTESDAHTWVEAYFPTYGWIPFEPTPQPGYSSIGRGPASLPSSSTASTPAPVAPSSTVPAAAANAPQAKAPVRGSSAGTRPLYAAVIGVLMVLGLVVGLVLLRPRSMRRVWLRLRTVSYLAGVPSRPSDTPIEFGNRLSRRFPEMRQAIETLTGQYSRAAYGNVGREPVRPSALDALRQLEIHLARTALRQAAHANLRSPGLCEVPGRPDQHSGGRHDDTEADGHQAEGHAQPGDRRQPGSLVRPAGHAAVRRPPTAGPG